MLLKEIFAEFFMEGGDDHLHARAMAQTGFWGAQGAGCIFMAKDTGRFLIAHRSAHVEQPGTWGTWGGAIDQGESPEAAAQREAEEEAGHTGDVKLIPLFVFEAKKQEKVVFRYSNFLAIVPTEFEPHLNWESQGFRWCQFGKWPTPLHFGLKAVLDDPHSVHAMQQAIEG